MYGYTVFFLPFPTLSGSTVPTVSPAPLSGDHPHAGPDLGPGVWHASELGVGSRGVRRSGHATLDAQLPGGGWPCSALTEVLQAQSGLHEWRLLLPALRGAAREGTVLLVGSPHAPGLAALAALGLAPQALLLVEVDRPAERLWAAEQALRCEAVTALVAWLPQARPEQLRRLHLAAQARDGAGGGPLCFAFRPAAARHESSAAPLRLLLRHADDGRLEVDVFKRRGPALDAPLTLAAPLPVSAALWRPSAWLSPDAAPAPQPARAGGEAPLAVPMPAAVSLVDHVVDRPHPTEQTPEPDTASRRLRLAA
jgi:protein ImuA